jgi:hypothetical protein
MMLPLKKKDAVPFKQSVAVRNDKQARRWVT